MITTTLSNATTADYVQYRVSNDLATFMGPNANDITADSISVRSLAPKRGNGQYGNRRSTIDLVRASTVTDLEGQTVVRNRKLAVTSSLPVGTTLAEVVSDAYELGSLLQDASLVEKIFYNGIIEH